MKLSFVTLIALVLLACRGNTQQRTDLKTAKDSLSYSIGMDIGRNFKTQSIDVNPDAIAQGIRDVTAGDTTTLTQEQAQQVIQLWQQHMMAQREERMKEAADKNKKEGETYCAENKKKPGVVVLPSGLQYKVIKAGTGRKPKATETVTVHYRGTLLDGTEFDSSHKWGKPATFALNQVMRGWIEALQLMPTGSTWELVIPGDLAYGDRGAGQMIGPNQTLIFEVELISIK